MHFIILFGASCLASATDQFLTSFGAKVLNGTFALRKGRRAMVRRVADGMMMPIEQFAIIDEHISAGIPRQMKGGEFEHREDEKFVLNMGQLMKDHNLRISANVLEFVHDYKSSQDSVLDIPAAFYLAEMFHAKCLGIPQLSDDDLEALFLTNAHSDLSCVQFISKYNFAIPIASLRSNVQYLAETNSEQSAASAMRLLLTGRVKISGVQITVHGWNGELGNRLYDILAALLFAVYTESGSINLAKDFGYPDMFEFQARQVVPVQSGFLRNFSLAKNCRHLPTNDTQAGSSWWFFHCETIPAAFAHRLMIDHVRPFMTEGLSSCVNVPAKSGESTTLVAHYTQDEANFSLSRMPGYKFPNCEATDSIFSDSGFQYLKVIASSNDHPCVSYHKKQKDVSVEVLGLFDGMCELTRAKHMRVSFSPLSEAAALLNDQLERLYHLGARFTPFSKPIIFCNNADGYVWENTTLVQYLTNGSIAESRKCDEDL